MNSLKFLDTADAGYTQLQNLPMYPWLTLSSGTTITRITTKQLTKSQLRRSFLFIAMG